jgi:CheY-like chemotaxis protein
MRALADHLPTHNPLQPFAFGSDSSMREVDPASPYRVLIADDQWEIREALRLLLKSDGYEIRLVEGPQALLESLEQDAFDLVLLDLNYTRDTTSGREGLDVLSRMRFIN